LDGSYTSCHQAKSFRKRHWYKIQPQQLVTRKGERLGVVVFCYKDGGAIELALWVLVMSTTTTAMSMPTTTSTTTGVLANNFCPERSGRISQ